MSEERLFPYIYSAKTAGTSPGDAELAPIWMQNYNFLIIFAKKTSIIPLLFRKVI